MDQTDVQSYIQQKGIHQTSSEQFFFFKSCRGVWHSIYWWKNIFQFQVKRHRQEKCIFWHCLWANDLCWSRILHSLDLTAGARVLERCAKAVHPQAAVALAVQHCCPPMGDTCSQLPPIAFPLWNLQPIPVSVLTPKLIAPAWWRSHNSQFSNTPPPAKRQPSAPMPPPLNKHRTLHTATNSFVNQHLMPHGL